MPQICGARRKRVNLGDLSSPHPSVLFSLIRLCDSVAKMSKNIKIAQRFSSRSLRDRASKPRKKEKMKKARKHQCLTTGSSAGTGGTGFGWIKYLEEVRVTEAEVGSVYRAVKRLIKFR